MPQPASRALVSSDELTARLPVPPGAPALGSIGTEPRHDWSLEQAEGLFALPFADLIYAAQQVHRTWHVPNTVQMSTLLSIKTGACPEDCAYCPQSVRYHTDVATEALMPLPQVLERARAALAAGATRFCMGAAYRAPKTRDLERIAQMVREVRALGLETCATLGMLTPVQARTLKDAGLNYYNHNLDTSEDFYGQIISTRSYKDRLDTLTAVREAGMHVCCGGIVGMGESQRDRAKLLMTLANLPQQPESVPINQLVRVPGTPLADGADVDPFDFIRTIAVARVMIPQAQVRLSAGREAMSDELQALAFLAGANSIFYGEKLLTTGNPDVAHDRALLVRLGMAPEALSAAGTASWHMVRLDSQELARELTQLTARHLRRRRRLIEAVPEPGDATRVQVEGRLLRNFCSNDYLGLSAHPALIQAASQCMSRFGFGAGASHLVTGHSLEHQALEEELAEFTGRERSLLFSTGYLANLGVIDALAQRRELILADRLCHASLLDGARLAGGELKRYAHADAAAAARLLGSRRDHAAGAASAALIITDGVFSMDGDIAPLAALAAIAAEHGTKLMVDDAHGLGVLGANGRGTLELAGLDARAVPVLIGTLGKAFGSFGAFVAGDASLIEYLLQHVRTYIYTTALPPAVAAATRAALKLIRTESWRRERLQSLVGRWRAAAGALGLPLTPSVTPIQPLIVGDAAHALDLSEALMNAGFWVTAIRPPTVPPGSARLRITFSAAHREADVDALADALGRLWRERSTA